MARSVLIESLRSQAARDVQAVGEAARAEAERLRVDLAAALQQERINLDLAAAAEVRRLETEGATAAEHRARELRAGAAVRLAERLLALARAELPQLRGGAPARLFEALARELPLRRWQRVRVNPADVELAARQFPDAAVDVDPAISGGMELECEDGRIRVSNTLETRLAIAWADLLPRLIAQTTAESRPHGTAA
jgi:vacuolar-type H+-ATPase subunit E/Vma4